MLTTWFRMDVMQQLFKEFINSQQRELAMKVEGMGGKAAALENEQAMKELVDKESELTAGDELAFATHSGQNRPFNLVELQQEINSDPDKAIKEHAESFNRKFDLQKRIVEDLGRVVRRDGDRVIYALTAGPHDRIVDPVCRKIFRLWVTDASPFHSGHPPHLEGHGRLLQLPRHIVSAKSNAGMARECQGPTFCHVVEGPLYREGCGRFGLSQGSRRLGTQVH